MSFLSTLLLAAELPMDDASEAVFEFEVVCWFLEPCMSGASNNIRVLLTAASTNV